MTDSEFEKHVLNNPQDLAMVRSITNTVIKNAVAAGHIKLEGLSDEEKRDTADDYLAKFIKAIDDNAIELTYRRVHTDTLLDAARNYVSSDEDNFAVLMYATWWEHWLNGLLVNKLSIKNISEKEIKQIIRSLNSSAKSSWLIKILDLPTFEEHHLKTMNMLSEKRNTYVHHKYPILDETAMLQKSSFSEFYSDIEAAISYFNEYESNNIFSSYKDLY